MTMEPLAVRGLALLLDASLRSLPLLAVAGIALLCLRRASAAARHLVLLLTLGCLLLLPLLSSALPGWQMRLWPRTLAFMPLAATSPQTLGIMPPLASPSHVSPATPPIPGDVPSLGAEAPPSSSTHHQSRQISWAVVGFSVWMIGVIAVLAPVLAGLACLRRIGRQSHLVTMGAVTDLASELGQHLGLRRPVRLRQNEEDNTLGVPMTWGWWRPVILLPTGADAWPEDRLRVVLLHELAHIRRGDWLWQMLAHVTCALYWFHPGVWLVARGLRAESERACDDQVLSAGVPATDYARHLVDVARTLSQRNVLPGVVLPMATPPITGRLEAVLQKGKVRSMMTRKNCFIAGLLTAAILAPLAALRPVARAQAQMPLITADMSQKTDPAAIRLLQQMATTYRSLQTYSCTEQAEGSGAMGMPYHLDLTYERPGKLVLTQSRSFGQGPVITRHLVLDGNVLYDIASDSAPGRYVRVTKPRTNYNLWQEALIVRCDVKFPITMELLENSDDLFKAVENDPHAVIRLGPPAVLDGVAVDTIVSTAHSPNGDYSSAMQIGHDDHLLRQITDVSGPAPNQKPMTMTQTFSNIHANPVLTASTFVFTPPADAVAMEVDPGGTHADPAAVALMTQMYAASDALKSFSCTLDSAETVIDKGSGKTSTFPENHATFAIQKPGRVAMMRKDPYGGATAVADGSDLYVTTTQPNALPARYLKLPVGPDAPNRLVWLSRFGNIEQNSPSLDFMPNAVLGWQTRPADGYDWKMGQPGVVDGEPVDRVTLRQQIGTSDQYSLLTLTISRRDHLLRQVSEDSEGPDHSFSRETETYTHLKINPSLPASLFVFTPPVGSSPVATAEDLFTHR